MNELQDGSEIMRVERQGGPVKQLTVNLGERSGLDRCVSKTTEVLLVVVLKQGPV